MSDEPVPIGRLLLGEEEDTPYQNEELLKLYSRRRKIRKRMYRCIKDSEYELSDVEMEKLIEVSKKIDVMETMIGLEKERNRSHTEESTDERPEGQPHSDPIEDSEDEETIEDVIEETEVAIIEDLSY